jgi:hypothetical protein
VGADISLACSSCHVLMFSYALIRAGLAQHPPDRRDHERSDQLA